METDSFFWQLLKQLPETLFALLGLPTTQAASYRFDAVEIKKSYRLDGLFVPTKANLPVHFVEVQFRRERRFYANLFAKVFSYLEANNPDQDWVAAALFAGRAAEPEGQPAYEDLLASPRVRRIYLDDLQVAGQTTPGLMILKLVTAPKNEAPALMSQLLNWARRERDCEKGDTIVELVEEVLLRRFTQLDREEIRRMFQLRDLRKSRVWQEAHCDGMERGMEKGMEIGIEKGIEMGTEKGRTLERQKFVRRWLAKGKSHREIAELLQISIAEVRRLESRK